MSPTQISLAQFAILPGEPSINLKKVRVYAEKAKDLGSSLLLIPELWATGFDVKRTIHLACRRNEGYLDQLASLCAEVGISIAGSSLEKDGENIYNSFLWYDAEGKICASYQKTHLFRMMRENQFLSAGDTIQCASTFLGKTGLAICYDTRFPEIFQIYTQQGAALILVCAEWPVERIEQWETLLRARAIENRDFIAAVNCVGKWRNMVFGGRSLIIDPAGKILGKGSDQEEMITASIELDAIDAIREALPFGTDRRPELYARYLSERNQSLK